MSQRILEEKEEWESQRKSGLDGVREMRLRANESAAELKAQKDQETEAGRTEMASDDHAMTPRRANGDGEGGLDAAQDGKEGDGRPDVPMDTDDDAVEY
jgi:hypothetical protein